MALHLMRSSLPFIKQAPQKSGSATNAEKASASDAAGGESLPERVLLHLCNLLDAEDTEPKVKTLVQDIVTEGVVVFFPDSKARMEYLFSMIGSVLVSYMCVHACVACMYVCVFVCVHVSVCISQFLLSDTNFRCVFKICRKRTSLVHGGSSLRLCVNTSARQTPSLCSTFLPSLKRCVCVCVVCS